MKGKVLGKAGELTLTQHQYDKLRDFTIGQGGCQSLCRRVYDSVKKKDGKLVAQVYDADMERISTVVQRPDEGGWQDLFREIMDANLKVRASILLVSNLPKRTDLRGRRRIARLLF